MNNLPDNWEKCESEYNKHYDPYGDEEMSEELKEYNVIIPVGATASFKVVAGSKEEAIEKALSEEFPPSVCHQCSNEVEIGEFHSEDQAEAYEIE